MSANADNLVSLVQQGRPTPEAVKEEAFRLWIEYGRSWRLVSQRTGIEERTLYRWGKDGEWEERRKREAAAFMPGSLVETSVALRLASFRASLRLQQIAFEAEQYGVKPDLKEIQALSLIVDRGGHSPVGSKSVPDVSFAKPADGVSITDLVGKSPDELMRLEQEIRARKP